MPMAAPPPHTHPMTSARIDPTAPPKLLVVTPTLGKSRFLAETVASVQAAWPAAAHVLVCPGRVRDQLAAQHPQCRVEAETAGVKRMYQAINQGISVDLPWDWFTYINDDDLLLPGFGPMAAAHMRRHDQDVIAYGETLYIGPDGARLFRTPRETNPKFFRMLMEQGLTPLIQQGTMVSRQTLRLLNNFSPDLVHNGDHDLFVRAVASGKVRFQFYPQYVGAFRIVAGQLSQAAGEVTEERNQITERHLPRGPKAWPRSLVVAYFRLKNIRTYLERFRRLGVWRNVRSMPCRQ